MRKPGAADGNEREVGPTARHGWSRGEIRPSSRVNHRFRVSFTLSAMRFSVFSSCERTNGKGQRRRGQVEAQVVLGGFATEAQHFGRVASTCGMLQGGGLQKRGAQGSALEAKEGLRRVSPRGWYRSGTVGPPPAVAPQREDPASGDKRCDTMQCPSRASRAKYGPHKGAQAQC